MIAGKPLFQSSLGRGACIFELGRQPGGRKIEKEMQTSRKSKPRERKVGDLVFYVAYTRFALFLNINFVVHVLTYVLHFDLEKAQIQQQSRGNWPKVLARGLMAPLPVGLRAHGWVLESFIGLKSEV